VTCYVVHYVEGGDGDNSLNQCSWLTFPGQASVEPGAPPPPKQMMPPSTPSLEASGNTEASSNLGGIVGGVVGGCFVPILLCILWLCGVFTKFGCPSPLKKPAASQQVELQQNPKAAGTTQPDTTTQQLKDLAELKEKGQLTDDEFDAAKARVLNKV